MELDPGQGEVNDAIAPAVLIGIEEINGIPRFTFYPFHGNPPQNTLDKPNVGLINPGTLQKYLRQIGSRAGQFYMIRKQVKYRVAFLGPVRGGRSNDFVEPTDGRTFP